ncbi:hypothetical protein ACLOJK_001185 [Asimina triloba]
MTPPLTWPILGNGSSAVMLLSQLKKLESMPGDLTAYPETYGQLHTTHSPKFLGLNRQNCLWPTSHFGDDIIISIINSSIWLGEEMLDHKGMPPVPARWREAWESGDAFNTSNCNRKLIGARSLSKGLKERGINISKINDYDSPRDFFGATGARGIAPRARVAMYKIGFSTDTVESMATDVFAGIDKAIADDVDVMSMSIGFPQQPYHQNVNALGAFAAMEKGIFVSCSAGNSGPHAYTVYNGAPWITTVGAGTIDRDYGALITLGDGIATIQGKSIYPENIYISRVPLYYRRGDASKENCSTLDAKEILGKIVFCSFANAFSLRCPRC